MGNDEAPSNYNKKTKISFEGKTYTMQYDENMTFFELLQKFDKECLKSNDKYDLDNFTFLINEIICYPDSTIASYECYFTDNTIFELNYCKNKDADANEDKKNEENKNDEDNDFENIDESIEIINLNIDEDKIIPESCEIPDLINIRFIKSNIYNFTNQLNKPYLSGILKLCLLKEIAIKSHIEGLPNNILNILEILKNNQIEYNTIEEGIANTLNKIKGNNIINFSNYVDEFIKSSDIDNYIIPKLDSDLREEILYIYNCLAKYVKYEKRFEIELKRATRESAFEYSVISLVIIEKKNVDEFENNKKLCKNRADRVLFHGTSKKAVSLILPKMFKISTIRAQHGQGVYFTEDLDSCWIYGSENNFNGKNDCGRDLNVPKVGEFLNYIVSYIYYDKKLLKRVYDWKKDPVENGINIAYAGMNELETIEEKIPNKKKLYGTEFVIKELVQICPFMSFKAKRVEYCVIWRDTNFSNDPVYHNEFDEIFKKYLADRMEYINKIAKFNIYTCKTSEEALRLVNRKKYNKIILISNIGSDFGGRDYIIKAREIIGNDVIVLFNAYVDAHLDWIKDFPNALFSNQPNFYEDFLGCFYENEEEKTKRELINLKKKIEKHYGVKFNFNNNFLCYPNFRDYGKLKDLRF